MSLTVESLISDPLLRTRLAAGKSGLDRTVSWAHTCEVSDPWNWLGSGELLMTDGYSFPAEPSGQVRFIEHLFAANIAGLALGEGFEAPPLTREAIQRADELGFPVLTTARHVPFVTIARVVADGNSERGGTRAARVLRLYDILRRSHGRTTTDGLLTELGRELNADLHVIELSHGRELLLAPKPLSDDLRAAAIERARAQAGQLSGFNRLMTDAGPVLLVPVGTQNTAALLVAVQELQETPDLLLAQHAAMIVEVEVERRAARASRTRDRGAVLARRMLDGSVEPEAAAAQLRALRLGDGPWRVTAWQEIDVGAPSTGAGAGPLADALAFVPWPHLYAYIRQTHLVTVDESQFADGLGLDHIGARVGVSQPLTSPSRFADAFREARWALESAKATGAAVVVYGSHGSYFMPNTVAEGEVAVRRLLGPILDYDKANNTNLVQSLQVYFEVNRSWQEGARRLDIHKQTLVYRMKKIEELTDADLKDFGVQAELYLALRTWHLLNAG
ncbi:hypothetical protein GCM10009798_13390 [Nocardioides panacihumi]|uniref:PucR family transcriptional regulator n=1 Tax=Nocardioides panacihumi TaxID=400774 RepID=A0ABN2QPQ7_9ACTN